MMNLANAGYVHRFLSLRKVLVFSFDIAKSNVHIKISDFWLSSMGQACDGSVSPLPVRWTDPQAILNRKKFSEKSDVWSFGVLVWELLSGAQCMPYWEQQDDAILTTEIVGGRRELQRPEGSDELVWRFAKDNCLVRNANARMRFDALLSCLRDLPDDPAAADAATVASGPTQNSAGGREVMQNQAAVVLQQPAQQGVWQV
jgi:serine/threonine protein kinase